MSARPSVLAARHIVLDIETLSTRDDAVIVAIAWEAANERGGGSWVIDLDQPGRNIDAATVAWWMAQPDDARAVVTQPGRVPLSRALAEFAEAVGGAGYVWTRGDLDTRVLRHAYGGTTPWDYWTQRDVRTAQDLVGKPPFRPGEAPHTPWADVARDCRIVRAYLDAVRAREVAS